MHGSIIKQIYGDLPETPLYDIAYGGDINGDGWPDLMIGQPNFINGTIQNAGRAFIYSGKDWKVIYTIVGQIDEGKLGGSISTAGDVDKDGYSEFMVGAHGDDPFGIQAAGAVYIHSGKDGSVICMIYGHEQFEYLGIAVHGGCDVNGDGLPDLIIGTSEDVNGIPDSGSAHVYAAKSYKASDEVMLGGYLEMNLHVPAQPFGPYYLAFSLGMETGIPVGSRFFPLNPDLLFMLTFGSPAFTGNLDSQGKRTLSQYIPNDPGLSGIVLYSAFLTIDPSAPKGVRTISNPEEIKLQ